MKKHTDSFRDVLPSDEVLIEPSGQFGQDLQNFRVAVHQAAEYETEQPAPFGWLNAAKRRRRVAQRRMMLAWATVATCAALLFAATLPSLHHPKAVSHMAAASSNTDDTALLEQVDTAISESVPSSLAPLAQLDDWTSTAPTNDETSLKKSEKKHVSQ
jgi:hypothetical protein